MSIERILQEENHPEVLRMLALWGIRKAEELQKEVIFLRKLEIEKNQLKLEMEVQATIFKKMIFGAGVEKRDSNRSRRAKEDEQLLLHAQSLVPPLKEEETQSLSDQAMSHEMATYELLEEARMRDLPEKISDWEEIQGLTENSTEVTVIERKYILLKHKRKKYLYKPSRDSPEKFERDYCHGKRS